MRSLLKRIISPKNRHVIRKYIESFDKKILPFFVKNRFLSSIYYCFFNRQFGREHQSVLQGRINYWMQLDESSQASAMLRRNIHRVEKGLIMRPRREVFGLAFIESTVSKYINCSSYNKLDKYEDKWAKDVLERYFDAVPVGANKLVDSLRQKFENYQTNKAVESDACDNKSAYSQPRQGSFSPYERGSNTPSELSYEELIVLCKQRRSVRWFKNKEVSPELINKAIVAASLAPSACNRQPFEFHVVKAANVAQDIGSIPMGTAGFSHNFQALIVVVGDLSCYPHERDRHVIYIDGSLASMQMMLAFETLGLSSCVINWPDIEQYEKRMSSRLHLASHQRPIMLMAVGYADPEGMIPFSQKKTTNQLLKEVVQ